MPCTPIWGTANEAAVAVMSYGSGTVIYLGFDFNDAGPRCLYRTNPWVTEAFKGALLYNPVPTPNPTVSVNIGIFECSKLRLSLLSCVLLLQILSLSMPVLELAHTM